MAEGGGEETASIREVAKFHRKYGSTSNHMKRNEVLIKHTVSPEETLQGIALRYGVTMEQIKRVNKIWTNDSLFSHKTLDIPVPRTHLDELRLDDNASSVQEIVCGDIMSNVTAADLDKQSISESHRNSAIVLPSLVKTEMDGSECDKSDQSIADILVRIDSSIAQTRNQVEKREKKPEYYSDDMYSPRRRSYQARMRQTLAQEMNPQVKIPPVVMTQGRKVQSSLQRLQREQDEMFELQVMALFQQVTRMRLNTS